MAFLDNLKQQIQDRQSKLVAQAPVAPPQLAAGMSPQELIGLAQQYRAQLRAAGYGPSGSDAVIRHYFPMLDINSVREDKPGGFSKYGGAVGDVLGKYVGPAVSLVNPGIGAGLTALGRTAGKLNDPGGLGGTKLFKDIAMPTAISYGVGKAGEALKGGAAAASGKATTGKLGGLTTITSAAKPLSKAGGSSILSTLGRLGKGALDFLGTPGGRTAADLGLGLLDVYGKSKDRKANAAFLAGLLGTQQAALGEAEKDFAARKPLRDASTAAITTALNNPNDIFRSRNKPAGFVG